MAQDEASKKAHENMLFKVAGQVAQGFFKIGPQRVTQLFKALEDLTPGLSNDAWSRWCDRLVTSKLADQDTANQLKELSGYPFPWGGIMLLMTIVKVKLTDLEAVMDVYALDRQYDVLGNTTPHPAPIDNLVRSMIIDPGRARENRAELKKHGFDETQIDNIVLSYYKTLDEGTLRTLWLRDEINESTLYERMRELGYTDQRTQEMIKTWKVIPGPQDLLHMVAKEAFEPDMYQRLGLLDDFPTEQLPSMEAHGLSRYWAEKYWIAHWDQPSIGQGFEMLHRDEATLAELDLLFRAVEIPPYWRQKLINIAYTPYTRVDVRRMHELNIINDSQLIRAYMDLGYDSEKALNMANFTIRFNADKEIGLTRAATLESYSEGLISRTEARAILLEQDYSSELADYYLTLEDYNRDKSLQKGRIDNLREQFMLNIINPSQARNSLNSMGLRGETIDLYLETWELDRYKFALLPSKSEIDRFLVKGIINQGEWRNIMSRHGYSPAHQSWYLEDMKREIEVSRRLPSKTDIGVWYKKNVISQTQYFAEMRELGYSEHYIQQYFKAL